MVVGLAGVIPFLATSMSTVFLAWDMNYTSHTGTGVIFDQKTAEMLLHIIEPLQIGYGAVVSLCSPFPNPPPPTNPTRSSSPSSVPSIGGSSGPNSAVTLVTSVI